MTDSVRVGTEGDTPVNPYSLLEAVNASSDTANTAWLIFLGIMAYFTIAVAGVSHKDLLLETPVLLPIMQVSVQQSLFFQFAPVILVLFHLGVVAQLVLLARKTLEFDHAVRSLEMTDRRHHPLRLELHNFFFVQAVAGPHRSAVMGTFLHGMSWLTLVVLPVVLLLFIQLSYLPYHDVEVTWTHRICVVLDIAMLVLIGVFLLRIEASFFAAFWRTTISSPVAFLVTTGVLMVVLFFSFFVATIPGEGLDRVTQALTRADRRVEGVRSVRSSSGFALPFVKARADGTLLGRFHRNLVVVDQDLAPKRVYVEDETSISLRGRDLRFARLDRSDMRRADLTGADLDGASLVGTDLTEARLPCADVSELILSEDREKARCVKAQGAVFTRAKLTGARLTGIDLRGARLDEAVLTGAEMSYARATGANFSSAQMDRVQLGGGANLGGATMLVTSLQGANLFGALMLGADLSSASLQGAILTHALLQGAVLRDADLEGADLEYAGLQRADMSGAKVRAADLRLAYVWQTVPPQRETLILTDLTNLNLRPIDDEESKIVRAVVDRIEDPEIKRQVIEAIEPIFNQAAAASWANSNDRQAWQSYLAITQGVAQEGYAKELTDHLASMMCKSRFANGSVATGIVQRGMGVVFRGNLGPLYERLRGKDCPAAAAMSPALMQRMSAAVDTGAGR